MVEAWELQALEELLLYLRTFEQSLLVREETVPRHWENVPLSELTPELWAEHVARYIGEKIVQVRQEREVPGARTSI
jgi:hypothetical protein